MIRSSREIIADLVSYGVENFEKENGEFIYTREGAHSKPRILYHKDITGKEITSKLLERAKERDNIFIYEYTVMTDILEENGHYIGILAEHEEEEWKIYARIRFLQAAGSEAGISIQLIFRI